MKFNQISKSKFKFQWIFIFIEIIIYIFFYCTNKWIYAFPQCLKTWTAYLWLNFDWFRLQASPLECEICKLLVTELDNLLKENKSQEIVIETVNKLCSALPEAFKKFVSTLIWVVINYTEFDFLFMMLGKSWAIFLTMCLKLEKL